MKNKLFLVIASVVLSLLLCSCGTEKQPTSSTISSDTTSTSTSSVAKPTASPSSDTASSKNVVEISEKMFLTQIDDIYFNFDLYEDKTVVVEGMFNNFYALDGETLIPVVYRRGPGCCGNDGWGGFYLRYDGTFPETDEWIRVTGIPVMEKDELGYQMLYLYVSSLEVKTERGAEFVSQ